MINVIISPSFLMIFYIIEKFDKFFPCIIEK